MNDFELSDAVVSISKTVEKELFTPSIAVHID